MNDIIIKPVRTSIIKPGDDIIKIITDSIKNIANNEDILVVSSKPILIAYNQLIDYRVVTASRIAGELSKRYKLDPRVIELIIRYSDRIYGGVPRFLLTDVNGVLIPNAGIDFKNIPNDKVSVLSISLLKEFAKNLYHHIYSNLRIKLGIVISDSTIYPLRLGTRAIALVVYGFKPIRDYRGVSDLFGRCIEVTRLSLADEIASAAHLVIGEGSERIPAAIVKGLNIELEEGDFSEEIKLSQEECIYRLLFKRFEGEI